ncbi:MAG: PorT family protein [Flavobacteriaceae bacterium]|nr:PorT family protein [Flavobacteriaceae bacterium]
MKKAFLVVMLSLGLFANAQEFRFGLKGGANLAKLTSSKDNSKLIDLGNRVGFHAGIMLEATFGNRFSIQPEVLYSSRGTEIKNLKWTLKTDYIQVPLMAKLYLTDGLSIEGGPQMSFNVNSKLDIGLKKELDFKDYVEPYSFSWCLGAGYEFGKVRLSARYNFGVTKTFSNSSDGNLIEKMREKVREPIKKLTSEKLKNGTLQISLGVYF